MENNIVEQLLRGSENVDRMKKEIECVVGMILGLFSSSWHIEVYEVFEFDGGKWEIEGSSTLNGKLPTVRCWIRRSYGSSLAYTSKPKELSYCIVQEVHKNLPVFVEGMMTGFPELQQQLQPFLNAADKFPPTK